MSKTVHQYFYELFVNDKPQNSSYRTSIALVLNADLGIDDGCTAGNVLEEMPLESNCGDDCKVVLNQAAALINTIETAHGHVETEHFVSIIDAAVDTCITYIRG